MKPVIKLHETYQSFVIEQLQQHYAGGLLVLVNKDWPLITKLWITNLADLTTSLRDLYCARGPAPRDPASMLRSFLLFLLTKPEIGITAWVDELYRVPLYAILSGFEPGDVPGVGTFYDFFARLWAASKNNIKPRKNKRKRKPKKGKKGEKAPTTTHGRIMLYPFEVNSSSRSAERSSILFADPIISTDAYFLLTSRHPHIVKPTPFWGGLDCY